MKKSIHIKLIKINLKTMKFIDCNQYSMLRGAPQTLFPPGAGEHVHLSRSPQQWPLQRWWAPDLVSSRRWRACTPFNPEPRILITINILKTLLFSFKINIGELIFLILKSIVKTRKKNQNNQYTKTH